jgi:hypothetical protein
MSAIFNFKEKKITNSILVFLSTTYPTPPAPGICCCCCCCCWYCCCGTIPDPDTARLWGDDSCGCERTYNRMRSASVSGSEKNNKKKQQKNKQQTKKKITLTLPPRPPSKPAVNAPSRRRITSDSDGRGCAENDGSPSVSRCCRALAGRRSCATPAAAGLPDARAVWARGFLQTAASAESQQFRVWGRKWRALACRISRGKKKKKTKK